LYSLLDLMGLPQIALRILTEFYSRNFLRAPVIRCRLGYQYLRRIYRKNERTAINNSDSLEYIAILFCTVTS